MTVAGSGEADGTSASGPRSAAVGRDITGAVTTGDYSPVTQVSLGPLRPIAEVPAAQGPVGVPGAGLFVGRERELALLDDALSSGTGAGVVVQAVHGLGGIGKSSLVARYVELYEERFSQVVWVSAEDPVRLSAGLAGFAVALEPQVAGALADAGLRERAVGWLCAHEGWLVVLDNVTDPADVRELLARASHGRFVITTRRSGGWAGIARPLGLDVLEAGEAREVVARTLGPQLSGLLAGVDELCAYLGWLPLAVEQAAAYMAQSRVNAGTYHRLLREHPGVMLKATVEGGAGRTVAQVWAVTLDRLADDPLCGQLLRILAWLSPEGVARWLLDAVGPEPDVVRALGRLAAYSMISYDGEHVVVHRLVQAVARTPAEHDPHRDAPLIDDARDAAIGLLRQALPSDPYDPAQWPVWRELAAHMAVFVDNAAEVTDTLAASEVLNRTARFLEHQGALARAIAYFERALRYAERELGPEHQHVLLVRHNLGHAYNAIGDSARAIPLYERSLADRERVLGPDHPDTLRSRNNLASAYDDIGDSARAIPLFEQTLADRERLLGPDHPSTLISRSNLAAAYDDIGDSARAIPLYEQTLADRERVLGPDHPNTLVSRNNLAFGYNAIGDSARAIPLYEQTLAAYERVLGPDHPSTFVSRSNLAFAYDDVGDSARAIPLFEQTLADRERVFGPDHPSTLISRSNLRRARAAAGLDGDQQG